MILKKINKIKYDNNKSVFHEKLMSLPVEIYRKGIVVNEFHFVQNLLTNPYDISFHPP